MGWRQTVQKNQPLVVAAALVIIVGCGLWIASGSGSRNAVPGKVYFFDISTGRLFPADRNQLPPMTAPISRIRLVVIRITFDVKVS